MKSKKPRRLVEGNGTAPNSYGGSPSEPIEAPGFLVRMVGKSRAKRLCRGGVVQPRRD